METKRPGPAGETLDTPQHRALASTSRVAILRLVRAAEAGMTTAEVATGSDLHLSTARAHLDRLVGAGLLVRERDSGGGPGRPAWRYRAAAPDPAPPPYRALAAALLQNLADTDFDVWQTAVRAGESWGLQLAKEASAADPVTALLGVLDGLGFTPLLHPPAGTAGQPVSTGGEAEIHLRTCPFLELVADHAETMCGLHMGVARGVLAGTGAAHTDVELLPFGAPDACVLRLLDGPVRQPYPKVRQLTRRAGQP